MPPRPSLDPVSSESSRLLHTVNHSTLCQLFARLSFFVVSAKLEDIGVVYERIEHLGGKCVASAQDARIIITALRGRPRLLRAIGECAMEKTILGVEYVHDAYKAALEADLSDSLPHLPVQVRYLVRVEPTGQARKRASTDSQSTSTPSSKRPRVGSPGRTIDMEPLDPQIDLREIPRYCVERPSPLICINQDIIDAIKPIYLAREFDEREQKNSNVLSYRRSMSILKSVPRRLRSGAEALKLVDVGEKVAHRIDEYLSTGRIEEGDAILQSARFAALNTFESVYSVGHQTAALLYDTHGCRTLDDLRAFYCGGQMEEREQKDRAKRRRNGSMTRSEIIDDWISLNDELAVPIPREEVREIAARIVEELDALVPGCEHTICGGYRRGKETSNDIDVVFRTPREGDDIGLVRDLYLRLSALGLVTHVLHVTSREAGTPIHTTPNNFDNLDKAFVILKMPGPNRLHRRVDLISAPPNRYAAAVLSWSGSVMFERDLRRFAEDRGFKFRAGLIDLAGNEINFDTEREIFNFLGLRYVPPELRNADG